VRKLLDSFDDAALAHLMTNLGGHCVETLLEAFAAADDETPTMFIAYTIKGFGLPLAGHKDNHSGMMNPQQILQLRDSLNIAEGQEWEPYGGLGDNWPPNCAPLSAAARLPPPRPSTMRRPCRCLPASPPQRARSNRPRPRSGGS
jgi:pyruvate dehydrogenase complex dehydrogenase (E1) component